MGENIMKGQVEAFKKGSDRALRDLLTPTLFDLPMSYDTEFTASPVGAEHVQIDDDLCAYPTSDENEFEIAKGHYIVGKVTGDGAAELSRALEELGSFGFVRLRVSEVSPISGYLSLRHRRSNEK